MPQNSGSKEDLISKNIPRRQLRNPKCSLNFIRLLRVVITPSVRGENDSKQSDEFQATRNADRAT